MNFSDWAMFEKGRVLNMMTDKILATYAAKVSQSTIKNAAAKPKAPPRAASKVANRERNIATLAALMAPPKNQTTSAKNLAKLAAALNK